MYQNWNLFLFLLTVTGADIDEDEGLGAFDDEVEEARGRAVGKRGGEGEADRSYDWGGEGRVGRDRDGPAVGRAAE